MSTIELMMWRKALMDENWQQARSRDLEADFVKAIGMKKKKLYKTIEKNFIYV